MNRRKFIKLSSISLISAWACHPEQAWNTGFSFPIHFQSDQATGHVIFQDVNWKETTKLQKDLLIVGGGIAGLAAACRLKDYDLALCELAPALGGSAGGGIYKGMKFSQGAHYDLTYPTYFGQEALEFLHSLAIIQYNPQTQYWGFQDQKYLISEEKEGQSFSQKKYREDVFQDDNISRDFIDHTAQYISQLPLPTRLIDPTYHNLNSISFRKYLEDYGFNDAHLIESIDYQMVDDYGGNSKEVSALAGLFYYAGRPYLDKNAQDFSPPQGNFYFIEKMAQQIPSESIYLSHLVRRIQKNKSGFQVEVIDMNQKQLKIFQVKKIIYAGHKHALQYVYPPDYALFEKMKTTPWLVINFILNKQTLPTGFWQNEFIPIQNNFLGFVDSDAQHKDSSAPYRVLTAYYCFPSSDRKKLSKLQDWQESLIANTLSSLSDYFKIPAAQLAEGIEQAFIKVMGHAMPLPEPNYLLNNPNLRRSEKNLVYAGVDTGRLPLFLEAIDSGLQAVQELNLKNVS